MVVGWSDEADALIAPQPVHVEVTLNGVEYTADGATIPINKFWFDERYNYPAAGFREEYGLTAA